MASDHDDRGDRVLVLAPSGRDAELAVSFLASAGLPARGCRDMADVCRELAEGAGALLIAEEAFEPREHERLRTALGQQPPWSDVPLIVVTRRAPRALGAIASGRAAALIEPLGNVTAIERPVRLVTLESAARAAVRARRRQYEVRDLLAELGRGVELRDQFLAMLGHELRNPLSATIYALEAVGRGPPLDARVERPLGVIRRQVQTLARMVDDMLDVARVTSGTITLDRVEVDLTGIVERGVRAVEPAAEEHGITLSLRIEAAGPIVGLADPVRLEQVVSNVLTNAIKYTPRGGRVDVTLERSPGEAVLRVRDTGIGIAPEMLPHIFELFVQADRSLERSHGGMGLGLTLVRKLVELHGGSVSAHSDGLGKGTELSVQLPVLPPAVSAPQVAPAEPVTGGAGTVGGGTPKRVLLVEDNADIRELLQGLLEEMGYAVAAAPDGPDGLALALSNEPDVAIIDIGLPGMSGYDVARAIRRAFGHEPYLVAMTGYGQPEDRARSSEAGFDAHLTKPVTLEVVERVLQRSVRAA